MKRRSFLQTVATVSAAPAAQAQQSAPNAGRGAAPEAAEQAARIDVTAAEAAAETVLRFFNNEQFTALPRLSDLLMPAMDGNPGALDAEAAEFLDFLIGESPAERQHTAGLDALNLQAAMHFGKALAAVDDSRAHQLLAPLREPWKPEPQGGSQNPTMTILALSMRASEYLAEKARLGEL
ncbi:MAG: gluconate 2-dehydrogenase subunit 3 family protein [Bryobacterales bacterium]